MATAFDLLLVTIHKFRKRCSELLFFLFKLVSLLILLCCELGFLRSRNAGNVLSSLTLRFSRWLHANLLMFDGSIIYDGIEGEHTNKYDNGTSDEQRHGDLAKTFDAFGGPPA